MPRALLRVMAFMVVSLAAEAGAQSSDLVPGAGVRIWSTQSGLKGHVAAFYAVTRDALVVVDLENPRSRMTVLLASVERVDVSTGRRTATYGATHAAIKAFVISATATIAAGLVMDLGQSKENGGPYMTAVLPIIIVPLATIGAAKHGRQSPPETWERILWRRK